MTSENQWRRTAACRGMDVNTFFPDRDDHKGIVKALMTCRHCPVVLDCARHAWKHRYTLAGDYGSVWGGMYFTGRMLPDGRLETITLRAIQAAETQEPHDAGTQEKTA